MGCTTASETTINRLASVLRGGYWWGLRRRRRLTSRGVRSGRTENMLSWPKGCTSQNPSGAVRLSCWYARLLDGYALPFVEVDLYISA
jgi:hypothetical protein